MSRSKFWEYHDHVDEPLCPTLLSLFDRHAQTIGTQIGLVLDPGNPSRYYKFRDQQDLAAGAPDCVDGSGCAPGGAVYSTHFFHAHEQAHEYAFRAWDGWSTGLVNEGEAVALSCDPAYEFGPSERPVDTLGSVQWRDLLYIYSDTSTGYTAAGVFVTYLADTFGWQKVADLYQRTPPGTSAADFEEQFASVYPMSVDEAWRTALSVPGAPSCHHDWKCTATPIAVGESTTPDCDEEFHSSIVINEQRGVVLVLNGLESGVVLDDCGHPKSRSYPLPVSPTAGRATHWASLAPGSYAITSRPSSPLPRSVEFRSYLPQGLVGAGCESAGSVSIEQDGATYVDFLPGRIDGWVHLDGGGRTYTVVPQDIGGADLSSSDAIAICDDCMATAACVSIPYGQSVEVVIGSQSRLRLRDVVALPGAREAWGRLVFVPASASDGAP